MEKILRIGRGNYGNVFISVEFKNGRLSISGVEGPFKNGDCKGSCGQIIDSLKDITEYAPGWDKEKTEKLREVWERWHLNDMRAGCEHQRESWDTKELLTLTPFTWGEAYHNERRRAEDGEMSAEEYAAYKETHKKVWAATIETSKPKYETPEIKTLLAAEYVKMENPETKATGWVTETEHPKGLLSKPCPVCGYKYGSAWLKEDVPAEVIEWLESLPETDLTPAWV